MRRSRPEEEMNLLNYPKTGSFAAVLAMSALVHGCAPPASLLSRPDMDSLATGSAPPFANAFEGTPSDIGNGASATVVAGGPGTSKAIRFVGRAGPVDRAGPDGTQRAELSPCALPVEHDACPPLALTPGQVVWIAFDLRVNGALPHNSRHNSVLRMTTGGRPDQGSPVMRIGLDDRTGRDLYLGDASDDEHHSLGAVPYERWAHIVIGVKINIAPEASWVEAWRDGVNVMPRQSWHGRATTGPLDGVATGTMSPFGAEVNRLELGLYRQAATFPVSFDLARLAIGRTRTIVEPLA
jgi:hypothetical protein